MTVGPGKLPGQIGTFLVKHLSTFVIFGEVCATMPPRPPAQGGLDRLHAGSAPLELVGKPAIGLVAAGGFF